MRRSLPWLVFLLLVRLGFAEELPWQVNRPIVAVKKELYRKHPRPGAAAWVNMGYVGPKLELLEMDSVMSQSDTLSDRRWRFSTDNGKTWSDFQPLDLANAGRLLQRREGRGVRRAELLRRRGRRAGGNVAAADPVKANTTTPPTGGSPRFRQDLEHAQNAPLRAGRRVRPQEPAGSRLSQDQPGLFRQQHRETLQRHVGDRVCRSQCPRRPDNAPPMGSLCFIGKWNPQRPRTTMDAGQARGNLAEAVVARTDGAGSRRTQGRPPAGRSGAARTRPPRPGGNSTASPPTAA